MPETPPIGDPTPRPDQPALDLLLATARSMYYHDAAFHAHVYTAVRLVQQTAGSATSPRDHARIVDTAAVTLLLARQAAGA